MPNNASTTKSTMPGSRVAAVAQAAAALTAMLAQNACPAQAFQTSFLAPTPRAMHHAAYSSSVMPATTMRSLSPWDSDCGGFEPFGGPRGIQRRRRRFGPMTLAPSGGFKVSQIQVRDPEVTDAGDIYKLTFDLPAEVDRDGFDVSVSGRLLTVKARVTREGKSVPTLGGWVSRSSRTDSVSRSFVLPEGVSTTGVTTSFNSEGKAEVKFNKEAGAATAGDSSVAATTSTVPHTGPAGTAAGAAGVGVDKTPSFSPSAEYLSSLSGAKPALVPDINADAGAPSVDSTVEPVSSPSAAPGTASSPAASERPSRPRSMFEALDDELGGFAKAMWGEDVLRFPTQEEMAERAEAAREARAKRVGAIRRATMAAEVSAKEDGSSYSVRVDLPEGATRDDVTLTITPDNLLRVSFAAEGRRSISKDVRLPKDALFSDIAARFEAEGAETSGNTEGGAVAEGGVSSLHVTVGRMVAPQPKRVDIM